MNLHSLLAPLVFTAVASLGTFGCSVTSTGDGSPGTSGTPGPGATSSSLEGSYAGSYSGGASGPVTMTVSAANVDVVATVGGKQYPGSGALGSAGAVNIGVGAGDGVTVTFAGSFAAGKGSGTWTSSVGTKGSWSVSR